MLLTGQLRAQLKAVSRREDQSRFLSGWILRDAYSSANPPLVLIQGRRRRWTLDRPTRRVGVEPIRLMGDRSSA